MESMELSNLPTLTLYYQREQVDSANPHRNPWRRENLLNSYMPDGTVQHTMEVRQRQVWRQQRETQQSRPLPGVEAARAKLSGSNRIDNLCHRGGRNYKWWLFCYQSNVGCVWRNLFAPATLEYLRMDIYNWRKRRKGKETNCQKVLMECISYCLL